MGRRLRSPRLPAVDVPGVDDMRWADVYVHAGRRGVALRNRCPQGQADPRAAIDGGASGVTRRAARTSLFGSAPPGRWPPNDVGGSGGGSEPQLGYLPSVL